MTASARGTAEAVHRNVRQKSGLNRAILNFVPGSLHCLVEYKAAWASTIVVVVEAAFTSRTCAECRYVADENQPTQDRFQCVACDHVDDACVVEHLGDAAAVLVLDEIGFLKNGSRSAGVRSTRMGSSLLLMRWSCEWGRARRV